MPFRFVLPGALTEDNGEIRVVTALNIFGLILSVLVLSGAIIVATYLRRGRRNTAVKVFYGFAMTYLGSCIALYSYRLRCGIAGTSIDRIL